MVVATLDRRHRRRPSAPAATLRWTPARSSGNRPVILDRHPDDDEPVDSDELDGRHPDDGDDDGDEEWLGGLRAAGFPVRTPPRPVPVRPVEPVGVAELVAGALAPSTLAAYRADWQAYGTWCHTLHDLDPIDSTGQHLAAWIAHLTSRHYAVSSLYRRLAAVTYAFELTGRPSPAADPLVRTTLAGATRRLGTAQRRAIPLTLDELRRLAVAAPVTLNRAYTHPMVRRDRALLLVGWAAALRRSELVGLDLDDLTFQGDPDHGTTGGLLLRIRSSKTDQTRAGAHIAVPWSTHYNACPVRALMLWVRHRRTHPGNAVFVTIDRHGNHGNRLNPNTINTIIKRHVQPVLGVDPSDYTGHSLRAGFVTEARTRHVPDPLIARHTRHRDLRSLHTYDRPVDLFHTPALAPEWW